MDESVTERIADYDAFPPPARSPRDYPLLGIDSEMPQINIWQTPVLLPLDIRAELVALAEHIDLARRRPDLILQDGIAPFVAGCLRRLAAQLGSDDRTGKE